MPTGLWIANALSWRARIHDLAEAEGTWLKNNTPPDSKILVENLEVGYFSKRHTSDWPGLVSPDVFQLVKANPKIGFFEIAAGRLHLDYCRRSRRSGTARRDVKLPSALKLLVTFQKLAVRSRHGHGRRPGFLLPAGSPIEFGLNFLNLRSPRSVQFAPIREIRVKPLPRVPSRASPRFVSPHLCSIRVSSVAKILVSPPLLCSLRLCGKNISRLDAPPFPFNWYYMQLDKLTLKSQEALQDAQKRLAREQSHQEMDGEHLLLALTRQQDSLVPELLQRRGVSVTKLQPELEKELARRHKVQGGGEPYASRDLQKALDAAQSEAGKLKDDYISTEHLLLGLLDQPGVTLKKILANYPLKRDAILKELASLRGNQRVTDQQPEAKFQALDKYGRDLTALARQGKIDPVIGRDEEIRRVMQVLTRRTKNNPVLIGEPGVGKTAIAEGLARRIISGDVPESLKNKRLVAMDLSAMIAGAKYRGEFEDRLKAFLKEITSSNGQIILFIDELHTLVGAACRRRRHRRREHHETAARPWRTPLRRRHHAR